MALLAQVCQLRGLRGSKKGLHGRRENLLIYCVDEGDGHGRCRGHGRPTSQLMTSKWDDRQVRDEIEMKKEMFDYGILYLWD